MKRIVFIAMALITLGAVSCQSGKKEEAKTECASSCGAKVSDAGKSCCKSAEEKKSCCADKSACKSSCESKKSCCKSTGEKKSCCSDKSSCEKKKCCADKSACKSSCEAKKSCCKSTGEKKSCCAEKAACKSSTESSSCCSKGTKTASISENDLNVLYFHGTRRCATCQAVEKVTADAIKNDCNGIASFHSINREDAASKELVDKYKVGGQTLLVVKGDEVVNLSNTAFLNARTKPEVLEKELLAAVQKMK